MGSEMPPGVGQPLRFLLVCVSHGWLLAAPSSSLFSPLSPHASPSTLCPATFHDRKHLLGGRAEPGLLQGIGRQNSPAPVTPSMCESFWDLPHPPLP